MVVVVTYGVVCYGDGGGVVCFCMKWCVGGVLWYGGGLCGGGVVWRGEVWFCKVIVVRWVWCEVAVA